ncbi:hypothetical protein J4E93_001528 [Alternaria ventricosa]|uniref:uncharacterized protein n=1 Tax=Alternaria ventricosa TaxID=1187951 RepID=UPI0020C1DB34|nr:uncharacterized protein J4E93_001528 [Alternaria ventricosa]KAI4653761.1 hypothetical protein J4E93_001528 [Alternaria ventricosa]
MSTPLATVAIVSIGQMGLGIAALLTSHNYRITTNISGRSAATKARTESAGIHLYATDEELVADADYILSIVPPRDAVATANRVVSALQSETWERERREKGKGAVWYLDLNAISPDTARSIAGLFEQVEKGVVFVDGGIIGGPPSPPPSETEQSAWTRPDIPLSGPHPLDSARISGAHLAEVLNTRFLGGEIGTASGLKCCFAALSKGFTALALQSFSSAESLGVLDPLREYLDVYSPGVKQKAEKSVVGCTGKAYRWVEEMVQIGECFRTEGGTAGEASVFREIAGVFNGLADVVERNEKEEMGSVEGVVGALLKDQKEKKS